MIAVNGGLCLTTDGHPKSAGKGSQLTCDPSEVKRYLERMIPESKLSIQLATSLRR